MLTFMHIPKTGGSTLRRILKKQYKNLDISSHHFLSTIYQNVDKITRQLEPLINNNDKIECLQGHLPFGLIEKILKNLGIAINLEYITFLRHPVERLLSHYCHYCKNHKQISLSVFINCYHKDLSNLQTSYICGNTPGNLVKAKRILENFSFVGITELFDQSLFIMKKRLNWHSIPSYEIYNVRVNRLSREEIDQNLIEQVISKNKLDIELYQYAKEQLFKELNNLNSNDINKINKLCNKEKEIATKFVRFPGDNNGN